MLFRTVFWDRCPLWSIFSETFVSDMYNFGKFSAFFHLVQPEKWWKLIFFYFFSRNILILKFIQKLNRIACILASKYVYFVPKNAWFYPNFIGISLLRIFNFRQYSQTLTSHNLSLRQYFSIRKKRLFTNFQLFLRWSKLQFWPQKMVGHPLSP